MTGPTQATKTIRNAKTKPPLASTSSRKDIISSLSITFFTILRAAWLLHPSQVVHQSSSTKITTSLSLPLSTMARNATTLINYNQSRDNINLSNMYGKKRNATKAAGDLQEGRPMKYVPYNNKGLLVKSADEVERLQKTRILHGWNQASHHPVVMEGFTDIYRVLTAPNGHKFTICQVIMSTKCSFDYITPLFAAVDVTPEGEVIVICTKDMKTEAESLLAHFGLYLAYIFGSVVWEAFSAYYKLKMDQYQYCPLTGRTVEVFQKT